MVDQLDEVILTLRPREGEEEEIVLYCSGGEWLAGACAMEWLPLADEVCDILSRRYWTEGVLS